MIPALEVKAPVAGVEWTTNQGTFDYVKTCATMPFVVVITHGANRMDSLVEDDAGELVHERDMNIGYPRLADFCAVIAAPKSGLSTTYNEYDEAEHWRTCRTHLNALSNLSYPLYLSASQLIRILLNLPTSFLSPQWVYVE
jgi:hypothetical protein